MEIGAEAVKQGVTVVTVGSVNQDIFAVADHFPLPGETVIGVSNAFELGGKGANQAVAVARAGCRSVFVGKIGDDPIGRTLRGELFELGVDLSNLTMSTEAASGTAHITVRADGENNIIVVPGANGTLNPEETLQALDSVDEVDAVIAQNETPTSIIDAVIEYCRAHNVPSIINFAPATPTDLASLQRATWLIVNEVEVAGILGVEQPTNIKEAELHIAKILEWVSGVVVTLGADGALLGMSGQPIRHYRAPLVSSVIDTTGAGDAFVGVFAASIACGMAPEVCVRNALVAGSAAVERRGAAKSYPVFDLTNSSVEVVDA